MNSVEKKSSVNILLSASVIFSLLYFGAVCLAEREKNLSLEIIDKKKKVKQLELQNEQVGEMRSVYKNWQKEMEYASDAIVNYSELFKYIIEIENLADENNVELKKDAFVKNKGDFCGDFLYTYYKIKISGTFNDLINFLACLENLKYYSDIENIKIIPESSFKNINSGKIVLSADLKIYANNSSDNEKNKN